MGALASEQRDSSPPSAPEAGAALAQALNQPRRLKWERKLIARVRAGQIRQFGRFYEAYGELLYVRVLVPKLGDRTAAEDALSETFRTALERLEQFEPRGTSIYFWLARVATNKAMDMHRAKGVTGRALFNLEEHFALSQERPLTPGEVLDGRDQHLALRERINEGLNALNPRYRRALELRFMQELDRERCAELMEVRVATFDVLLLRALKALRKHWQLLEPSKEMGDD